MRTLVRHPKETVGSNDATAITMDRVVKQYAGSQILKGVSLTVPRGELVAITGHSGSGKTTLLRMIQDIEQPDEGSVTIFGEKLGQLSTRRRRQLVSERLGIGFQSPMLSGNFTVAENVKNTAAALGRPVTNRRLAELACYFGMGHKLEQPTATLSGGEKMRASLIRTLATKPDVVLLDEPTSALDTALSVRTFEGLRQLVEAEGTTVVTVTHDADVVRPYLDREFVMESGYLVSTELYRRAN